MALRQCQVTNESAVSGPPFRNAPFDHDAGTEGRATESSGDGTAVGDSGRTRRVRLTPASAIRMRRVSWLWQDRIPTGALTMVPGREGIGKSLTLAWLAGQITRGVLPGHHEGAPRPVVYAASEDSWSHTIAPRLYAAGADLDMVYRVDVEQDGVIGQLTLPRDCMALADEIASLGVALLAETRCCRSFIYRSTPTGTVNYGQHWNRSWR